MSNSSQNLSIKKITSQNYFKLSCLLVLLLLANLCLVACAEDATPTYSPDILPPVGVPIKGSPANTNAVINPLATALPGSSVTAVPGTPYPASTAGVPPTPTALAAIKPEQQILNMPGEDIRTFDPALAGDQSTGFVVRQLYSSLLSLDNNLAVIPDLAETMPLISDGGTLYTFKVRIGAKFQSGREISAEDFKYSLERATNPSLIAPEPATSLPAATQLADIAGVKEKIAGTAREISGVKVVDRYTLQIKLETPRPQFLARLTTPVFMVLNQVIVEQKGFEQLDGSGAFQVAEYRRGQYLKLKARENYHNGVPRLNQVNILLNGNPTDNFKLYEQGKLDIAYPQGADLEKVLRRGSPYASQVVTQPQLETHFLGFNTRARPFDDARVREAFALVLDRPRLVQSLTGKSLQPAQGVVPPGLPGYAYTAGKYNYDVSRARDLLSQSNYLSPANLPRITIATSGDQLAKAIQETYQQAFGIEVEVRNYDYRDFTAGLAQRQFQMFISALPAGYPDPHFFLFNLFSAASSQNDTAYNRTQFDDLLKSASLTTDLPRRNEIYSQAEQLALNELPLLPLYYPQSVVIIKPYLKALAITGMGIVNLKDVYIVK